MDLTSAAAFIDRSHCINCNGIALREVAGGRYRDEPLHGFLAADPWGESPLPYLKEAHWQLVRCTECGQTFHSHILDEHWNEIRFSRWMSAEAIKAFKAQNAANDFECERSRVEHVLRIERLTRDIRGPSPVRILDFGCGFGEFLATCQRFGFDAHGVDRASPRSEGAVVKIYPSLDDIAGDKFHAITLFEVLEHVDQPAVILQQLWSRLVADGLLYSKPRTVPACRTFARERITTRYIRWSTSTLLPMRPCVRSRNAAGLG